METEVICISSDDESDSQKENRKNQYTSTMNSTEIDNTSSVCTKVENLSSNDEKIEEKIEENNRKRKMPQIIEEKRFYNNIEKKRKLDLSQNISDIEKNNEAMSNCILQPNKDREPTIEKPKLIEKERKKISYVTHDIFPQFISLCLQKDHDSDMEKIINKLKRRYEELDPAYATSESFALFLNEKRQAIMNDKQKLYVYIREVMNEMKRRVRKNEPHTLQNNESYDAVPSTSYARSNSTTDNITESDYEEDIDDATSPDTRKKIKQILQTMRKCEARIKKLEEAEVNFDDEGDSTYIKVERYKQRMVELYNKLCELTGDNADAGRAYLRPKHISTTRIVAMDQAITNFINAKICKRNQSKKSSVFTNDLIFPNYRDILGCVSRCNEKKNLDLDKKKQIQMAKKAFVELGEYLQRARRNDYWDTFSLYLENKEEDPAIKNKDLAKKLSDNRCEGERRLTAVFEKYSKKQEEMKELAINDETTTEEEENEEESSIDDEDESKDNSFLNSSSEDNDSDIEIDNIIIGDKLSTVKKKDEINIVDRNMDKVILSKDKADISTEECNKKIEIKVPAKENNIIVSTNDSKSVSQEKIRSPVIANGIIAAAKNTGANAKTQEDSLPNSVTDCTNIVNRIEDVVAEVITEDVPKVITNPVAEVITGDEAELIMDAGMEAELIMGDITEVITDNVAETITGNLAEVTANDVAKTITGDVAEVIADVAETTIGDIVEVMTEDIADIEKMMAEVKAMDITSDKQQEEEKKPLLRVRSFAKPPTTWEDGRHKANKTVPVYIPKINQTKDVIDLTNESSVNKPAPVITKCAIQLGNKVVPIMKTKHPTLVISSTGNNIISVENITNNYLKVNTRTGQIIAPVRDIHGSTIIRVPSVQATTARQNQPQNANISTKPKTEAVPKRNETILRIIPPNKAIVVSKLTKTAQTASKVNVHSSTSK